MLQHCKIEAGPCLLQRGTSHSMRDDVCCLPATGEHGGAVAALSPPPARSPRVPDMCVSPAFEAGGGSPMHSGSESGGEGGGSGGGLFSPALPRLSGAGDAELQQRLLGLRLRQGSGEVGPLSGGTSVASGSPAAVASAAATDDDDFGEFEAA